MLALADDDGSGDRNVIDVQLKTVVLTRPTSLNATADSRHVSLVCCYPCT